MSLTLDGKTLDELGLALLENHEHPAAPPTRDYTVAIPGQDGEYDFGSDLGPRPFNLPLLVKPQKDRVFLSAAIRKMVAAFTDIYGKPKTVKLVYDYEPDRYYMARYSGSLPIERYFKMGKFELPMTAFDPIAYSLVENDEVTWGSEVITFQNTIFTYGDTNDGVVKTITSPQSYNVNVSGLALRPIIYVNGSADSLIITINGKSFVLKQFSNANFLIDCKTFTVVKDSVNGMGFIEEAQTSKSWLELIPGQNLINIDGINLNFMIQVKFRDRFV